MRARLAVVGAAGLVLWLTDSGGAYWLNGQRWASGSNIVMHLQLGSSGTLLDGSSSWGVSAEGALARWNQYLSGVEFRVVRDSTSGIALRNGVNNVFWDDDIYGDPFGDAVAYALWIYQSDTLIEGDVIFDRSRSWNSYRGNLRRSTSGGTLYDLRRVALHEFGHVLGLGHPYEHGQSVSSIMNRASDIDDLQTDDINGIRALYGSSTTPTTSNRSPTVTVRCNPCTVESGATTSLSATATDPDGDSLTYQWTAPQGTFTNATASTTTWTAPLQPATVVATITVQDGRGARASATLTLQVVFRDRLRAGARLLPGQSLVSTNGQYRLLYQNDGNLVLYDDVARRDLWSTNTAGTSAGYLTVQGDGNLVLYNAQSRDLWATGTVGNSNAYLIVQNDANVVLYRSDGQAIWDRFR